MVVACGGGGGSQASPSPTARQRSPSPTAPATLAPLHFQVTAVATGLEVPWELAQAPGGLSLLTERMKGQVRVLQNGQLQQGPALGLSVAAGPGNESGLLGLALHPGFPNPPYVYAYYTYPGASGKVDRLSRFTYSGGTLGGEQVLIDGIPGGSCCHYGGRLAFGPDGDLYVTVGDGQVPQRAEDVTSLNGKILRVADDGSPAPGNPFGGSRVYAYGFRNPQGLAWDPSGHLYVSDNGPTGELANLYHHDSIFLVTPGGFHGWPIYAGNVATGQQPTTALPTRVAPVVESGDDTWAPSGMTFYTPAANQQPTLLVGTLTGQAVRRFVFDPANPAHLLSQEVVLNGQGRTRDVVATPDHCILVLTSNRDGRGSPHPGDDQVLRACPA